MTVNVVSHLVLLLFNLVILTALPSINRQDERFNVEGTKFDTNAIINTAGYVAETHKVITSDGYILEMHRIPYGRNQEDSNEPRVPVFIMHGLTAASNGFVERGANRSIGFNLADAGYDVWLGNARGNRNSRFHVTLSPDEKEDKFKFFDFTWEEIGMIDVPAMIDYVLEKTGYEKLHYIGHSQGGTAFLVLNSMRPEYNEKFRSAHLLAGVGYMEYFPNKQLTQLAKNHNIIYTIALSLGIVEVFSPNTTLSDLPGFLPFPKSAVDCTKSDEELQRLCDILDRDDTENDDNDDILTSLLGGAGSSTKQFVHYGQNIDSKEFSRWDYGTAENIEVYGSEKPPIYDISLIKVNTTMHYTLGDILLDERDVLTMAEVMPNTVARKVARETFDHSDFITAADAKELVTDFIIEEMKSIDSILLEIEVETDPTEIPDVPALTGSSSIPSVGVLLKVYLSVYILGLFNIV